MPIYDYTCPKCGKEKKNEISVPLCDKCKIVMKKEFPTRVGRPVVKDGTPIHHNTGD